MIIELLGLTEIFQRQNVAFKIVTNVLKCYPTSENISQNLLKSQLIVIISAHPYCAPKFTCHVMHRARAKF